MKAANRRRKKVVNTGRNTDRQSMSDLKASVILTYFMLHKA